MVETGSVMLRRRKFGPPMAPKKGVQRKKLIGDAVWISRAGAKKKFYIYSVTPWCLVLKFKFIGATVWIGMVCAKKFNIR
jgi:hypothetical protein